MSWLTRHSNGQKTAGHCSCLAYFGQQFLPLNVALGAKSTHAFEAIMDTYNPNKSVNSENWLALDEDIRIN